VPDYFIDLVMASFTFLW